MSLTTEKLTSRELEIYQYLLKGLDYYTIADKLFVERNTIATHVMHIFSKLLASSRYELMARRIQELEDEVKKIKGTKGNTRVNKSVDDCANA